MNFGNYKEQSSWNLNCATSDQHKYPSNELSFSDLLSIEGNSYPKVGCGIPLKEWFCTFADLQISGSDQKDYLKPLTRMKSWSYVYTLMYLLQMISFHNSGNKERTVTPTIPRPSPDPVYPLVTHFLKFFCKLDGDYSMIDAKKKEIVAT